MVSAKDPDNKTLDGFKKELDNLEKELQTTYNQTPENARAAVKPTDDYIKLLRKQLQGEESKTELEKKLAELKASGLPEAARRLISELHEKVVEAEDPSEEALNDFEQELDTLKTTLEQTYNQKPEDARTAVKPTRDYINLLRQQLARGESRTDLERKLAELKASGLPEAARRLISELHEKVVEAEDPSEETLNDFEQELDTLKTTLEQTYNQKPEDARTAVKPTRDYINLLRQQLAREESRTDLERKLAELKASGLPEAARRLISELHEKVVEAEDPSEETLNDFEQELDTLKTTLEQTYNQKPEDARTAVKPTRDYISLLRQQLAREESRTDLERKLAELKASGLPEAARWLISELHEKVVEAEDPSEEALNDFEQELDTLKTTLEQTYNQKPEDARTAVKPTRDYINLLRQQLAREESRTDLERKLAELKASGLPEAARRLISELHEKVVEAEDPSEEALNDFEQELDTLKTTLEQTYNQKPEDARTAVKPTRDYINLLRQQLAREESRTDLERKLAELKASGLPEAARRLISELHEKVVEAEDPSEETLNDFDQELDTLKTTLEQTYNQKPEDARTAVKPTRDYINLLRQQLARGESRTDLERKLA